MQSIINKKKISYTMNINIDYIAVIKENEGILEYCEEGIAQNQTLNEELEKMREDTNLTIWNIWDEYLKRFKTESDKDFYHYLIAPYDSAIFDDSDYCFQNPKFFMMNYQKDYSSYELSLKENEPKLSEEKIKEKIETWKKNRRATLLNKIKYYIYARNYYMKALVLKSDEKVKMYSIGRRGWEEFEYKVSDDISISVSTNFGYGDSSYFICIMRYKNILIIPYSKIIRYYYANGTDIIHCTRHYYPDKKNWEPLLKFVAEAANMAKLDTERFIKHWILDELKEMKKGLELILKKPYEVLQNFLYEKETVISEDGLYESVKIKYDKDAKEYKILPHEKTMVFKAEKITGALLFLDNLKSLKEVSLTVDEFIDSIIKLCNTIQPEIEKYITSLCKDIKNIQEKIENISIKINEINNSTYFVRLEKIMKKMVTGLTSKELEKLSKEEIEPIVNTPEYQKLKYEKIDLENIRNSLCRDKSLRQNFLETLRNCKIRIETHINNYTCFK